MTVQNTLCMESCSWSRIVSESCVGLKSHRIRGGGRRREEGSQVKEKTYLPLFYILRVNLPFLKPIIYNRSLWVVCLHFLSSYPLLSLC